MIREDIAKKLCAVFREVFKNDGLEITDATTAADVDGWDSLSHIGLIFRIEKAFKIRFTTKEVITFKNVGELIDAVARKLPEQSAP